MAIRKMYDLEYRPVHINDTHAETMELAEFFFKNPKDSHKELRTRAAHIMRTKSL